MMVSLEAAPTSQTLTTLPAEDSKGNVVASAPYDFVTRDALEDAARCTKGLFEIRALKGI